MGVDEDDSVVITPDEELPPPQEPKRPRTALIVALTLVAIAAGALAYLHALLPKGSFEIILHPGRLAFGSRSALNVLVLGIDENWTRRNIMYTKGARSDTNIVVHVERNGKSLKILSIPRDTRVFINEKYGWDKMNAAHAFGGVKMTREVVERFLGITIDHYVVLKLRATQRLVDALGGVDLEVEKDMDYDDNWGHLHIHLKKGRRHLNGEDALGYARFRNDPEGDRGRMRRQQQLINAIIAEAKKPANLSKLPDLVKVFKANIETDFRVVQLMDLANLYRNFDRTGLKPVTLPGDDSFIRGIYYMVPREEEKRALMKEFCSDESVGKPLPVRVEVRNGTKVQGLAKALTEKLETMGYTMEEPGNAKPKGATEIVDHTGRPGAAQEVAKILGCGKVVQGAVTSNFVDITVVVGKDFSLSRLTPPSP